MVKVLNNSTVSLRLPGELRAEIEKIAEAEDRPMAYVLVRAVREHVERLNQQSQKPRKT